MDKNHQQIGYVDEFMKYKRQVDYREALARTDKKRMVKVKSSSLVEVQINSKLGIRAQKRQECKVGQASGYES